MSQITIQDFAVMVQIIDAGAERGQFKGPELKVVGDLRDRLVEFLKERQAEVEQAKQAEGATNESTSAKTE